MRGLAVAFCNCSADTSKKGEICMINRRMEERQNKEEKNACEEEVKKGDIGKEWKGQENINPCRFTC
jgi:hypothetical protein